MTGGRKSGLYPPLYTSQWHGARGGPQSARVFGILNILEAIWVGGFWSSVDTVIGKAPKWGHQKVAKTYLVPCAVYRYKVQRYTALLGQYGWDSTGGPVLLGQYRWASTAGTLLL